MKLKAFPTSKLNLIFETFFDSSPKFALFASDYLHMPLKLLIQLQA